MSIGRPSQADRRDVRAVERLAVRGFALAYIGALVTVGSVGWWIAAVGGHDPSETVALIAGLATFATVAGVALAVVARVIHARTRDLASELADLRTAYDRARLDSLIDGLTGLGNHRGFQEELEARIVEAREDEQPLALLMLDVDDLKKTNDRGGHAAGDEMLRTVAQILRANVRRSDRAYRIGGDEFAMLLPDTDVEAAALHANHILAAALSGNHGSGGPVSLTIGVTAFPVPSAGRQQMLIHADAALYSGKRHGRTTVERFDPLRHGIADDERTLVELEAAVQRIAIGDLLRPVYQPIFSLRTGEIIGHEGLVRLQPGTEFRDPSSLFVAAEATRRTVELDVVSATTVLAGARELAPSTYLAINLSPRTLESDAFSPLEVLALARRHGVAPTQLVVELTEREAVEDLARLQVAVTTLRRHGVRVAIDDVGAGNAGLRLMSAIDFDIMKIDLSLVRAGAHHEPSEAVLRALSRMAEERGRRIVAEGIESVDLLEAVLELRFDAGQGYLLGRPGPKLVTDPAPLLELVAGADESAA